MNKNTISIGNLHFCTEAKHMLGNNPFKCQREFLVDVVNMIVESSDVFREMHQYFTYLPGRFESQHGSMFFKYKFDNTSLYVVYATGQLRRYNLNKEGKIRSYQGSRLTTINCMSEIQDAIALFNADNPYHAAKSLSTVYEMAMKHLLQKAKAGKLCNNNSQHSVTTRPNTKATLFKNIIETQQLLPAGDMTVEQMFKQINLYNVSIFLKCKKDAEFMANWAGMGDINTCLEDGAFAKVQACFTAPYLHNGMLTTAVETNACNSRMIVLNYEATTTMLEYNQIIEQEHKVWQNQEGKTGLTATAAVCTNGIESFILKDNVILSEVFEVYYYLSQIV